MVNRVLLSPTGLKVSQAGYDVLSASGAQLLLNTDYAALSIYMEGSVTIPTPVSGVTGFQFAIPFGKTFPSVPFVQFDLAQGGKRMPISNMRGFYGAGSNFISPDTHWFDVYVEATTTGISCRGRRGRTGSGTAQVPANGDPVIYYKVMEFNL